MANSPLALFNQRCAVLNVPAEFNFHTESGSVTFRRFTLTIKLAAAVFQGHQAKFVLTLTADNISVTSSASTKQMAKQTAALKFLEAVVKKGLAAKWGLPENMESLMNLVGSSVLDTQGSGEASSSKRSSSTVRENVAIPDYLKASSILRDMARMNSWPDPVYKIVESFNDPCMALFTVEAKVGPICLLGTGESPEEASENAAGGILEQIKSDAQHQLGLFGAATNDKKAVSSNAVNNPVSMLQEKCAKGKVPLPQYQDITEMGTSSPQMFTISVKVLDMECIGHGRNKKAAKQNCAAAMLEKLNEALLK